MVKLKTVDVKALVEEVLDSLPQPRNEHVILVVFQTIESNLKWFDRYRIVCNKLDKSVVNQWIGKWTLRILDAVSIKQVQAEGTSLTETYSTLRFK